MILALLYYSILSLAAPCTDEALMAALMDLNGGSRVVTSAAKTEHRLADKLPTNSQEISSISTGSGKSFEVQYLAQGARGLVYDIKDSAGKPQVLKIPKDNMGKWDLIEEAQQADKLKSTSIPHSRVLDSDKSGSYLIKEKIEGKSLSAQTGPYTDNQMAQLVHIYRQSNEFKIPIDLKKDNFIVAKSGEITLIDFGVTAGAKTYFNTGRGKELWKNMFSSPEDYQRFLRMTDAK